MTKFARVEVGHSLLHLKVGDKILKASDSEKELNGMRDIINSSVRPLVEALEKIRDCDWTIGRGDRMDPVRDIARKALEDFR